MGQSNDKYKDCFQAYEFTSNPSHCLNVTPLIIAQVGADKGETWNEGARTALAYIAIGLRKDGILRSLLMQNKIAELTEQKAQLQSDNVKLQRQLDDEKALNKQYRRTILQASYQQAA